MSPSSARSARKCRQKQTHIDLLSIRQPQMDSLQPWHSKSQLSSPPQVMAARLLLAFIFIASSGGMVGARTANSQPQIVSAGSPVCRILQGMGWDGHTALSSPGGIPKSQGEDGPNSFIPLQVVLLWEHPKSEPSESTAGWMHKWLWNWGIFPGVDPFSATNWPPSVSGLCLGLCQVRVKTG